MDEKPVGDMLLCLLFGVVGLYCLRVAVGVFMEGKMDFMNRSKHVIYTATGWEAMGCGAFILLVSVGFLWGAGYGLREYFRA